MWQDYFRCSETTYKWGGAADPFNRFDPRHALAKFLSDKFEQAGWSISREPREGHMADTTTRMKEAGGEADTGPAESR